jgi:type VI secretion system secreted protein VgrG
MTKYLFSMAAGLVLMSAMSVKGQSPFLLPPPTASGLDKAKSPEERQKYLTDAIRKDLPRLGDGFEVLAPGSNQYNAWSYVRGVFNQWLIPQAIAGGPVAGVDAFLRPASYTRLSTFDVSVQPGKQKVAVFCTVKPDGDPQEATHAAVQQADGTWVCKCGGLPLIRVRNLEQLRGPTYGLAMLVYVRDAAPAALPIGLPRF